MPVCWCRLGVLALLVNVPATASASNDSGMFFLFMEVPILLLTCTAVAVCFAAPRGGLIFAALVLLGNLMALGWASESGYTNVGGYLLIVSAVLQAFGIVVATRKLDLERSRGD